MRAGIRGRTMTTTWAGIVISFLLMSALLAIPALALARTPAQPSPQPAKPPLPELPSLHELPSLPELPWGPDVATYLAAQPDLRAGSIKALAPHVAEFEAALAHGRQFFPDGATLDHHKYVMADGPTENLLVTLAAAAKTPDGAATMVTVVPNIYPLISLELGSYYNQTGRPQDAVRVLDEGLALTPSPEGAVGAHAGAMMSEKGAALGALKHYPEALDVFDQALASHVLTARDRARLDRGKGFVFTEMNRLDEAEAAFRDSLQQEPGNPRALSELGYIARLRAGGPKAPPELFAPPPKPRR